ncbi:pentatricopeptide repeat-containing protein At1g76280 [Aristolochia californica]|uniref:pentatricopeptide repeat-containing protein At1g76280 n=1 Tax=Aristolochia californica TaxID=171875 RepID=UPI0035DF52C8
MQRIVWTASRRLLVYSLWSSQVRKNVVEGLGFPRSFTSLEGNGRSLSYRRSVQVEIVDALRSGERDRALNLLDSVVNGQKSLGADNFVSILNYCAKSPDPLFAMETWKAMERNDVHMNRKCYMFIVGALSKGGYLKEAYDWLSFLGGSHSFAPVLPMYNSFLNGCAVQQNFVYADYCLGLMETQLTGKSEITYWELLKLAVWQQNLSAVHEIWKECTKYYSPSIISLRKFIWSFTRLGDLGSACEALQRMVALALQKSTSLRASPEGQFQSSGLDIPIPTNNSFLDYKTFEEGDTERSKDFILKCIDVSTDRSKVICGKEENVDLGPLASEMRSSRGIQNDGESLQLPSLFGATEEDLTYVGLVKGGKEGNVCCHVPLDKANLPVVKVLRWSFSDVIHACAHSKKCELAEHLFLQMQSLGLEPSQHTFDGLVKAVIPERGVNYGVKVVKAMEQRNLKPYNATLATLSVGYSRALELDLAEAMLDQISENQAKQVYPFNALLSACDAVDQPERAVRVLAKMKQLKIKSDVRTYELLFSLFGKVNAPYENGNILSMADARKRIRAIEMDMSKSGVEHTYMSMKNLMKALGDEGMIRELLEYLCMVENWVGHANTDSATVFYNIVLHALVECNEVPLAYDTFRKMKLHDIRPNAATYNIMIDSCSSLRCYNTACAFLSLMLQDGFFPDTCTYSSLMKILLANEHFEGTLYLLEKAIKAGIQPDVLLFNTVLEEASVKSRINIIEHVTEQMHQAKVQPDPSTCAYVFSAYIDQDFVNTAVEALQVLSLRMISEDESVLEEKQADFEDLVLNDDSIVESRIVEFFKCSEEHLAAALLNLRWCAINGYSISWSPSKSLWAMRLSSTYGVRRDS